MTILLLLLLLMLLILLILLIISENTQRYTNVDNHRNIHEVPTAD